MSTMHTGYSSPRLRASDADRDAVLAQLSENFQAGRLTSDEFDDRSGRALSARTVGDLDALMTDLPATPLTGPVPTAGPVPEAGPMAPPVVTRSPGVTRLPLVVIIVGVAVLAGVLGKSGHHSWDFWWIIPIAALIVRRAVRHRHGDASAGDRRPGGRTGIGGW